MITKDFNNDFDYLVNRIFVEKKPTVFSRYADGEVALIKGKMIAQNSQAFMEDHWSAPNESTLLGRDLEESLKNNHQDWFYGIACGCCDKFARDTLLLKLKYSGVADENITYSNLWINGNYKKFKNICENLQEGVVYIGNHQGQEKPYPFPVKEYFPIEDDCVHFWENNKASFLEKLSTLLKYEHTLFFISAGPMSEVIVDFLWKNNKTNRYIDVGSSLDEYNKGRLTRPYMMKDNPYYNKACVFGEYPLFVRQNNNEAVALNDYIKKNNIWIVVQGPMTYFNEVRPAYNDVPNVVWSSWKSDREIIRHEEYYVVSRLPFIRGCSNVYCQAKSTLAGIRKARQHGARFIFKMRADMAFSDVALLLSQLKLDGTMSFGAYHNWGGGYLIDYFIFGPIEKMVKMWQIPYRFFGKKKLFPELLMTENFKKHYPNNKIDYIAHICLKNKIKCYWYKYKSYVDESFATDPLFSYDRSPVSGRDGTQCIKEMVLTPYPQIDNVCNFMYTHRDYKDVWPLYFGEMSKYFLAFRHNYVFVNAYSPEIPPYYTQIIYNETLSYTDRLLQCLEQLPSHFEICFYAHEDMFLYDYPDMSAFRKYVNAMFMHTGGGFFRKRPRYDFIRMGQGGDFIATPSALSADLHELDLKSKWIFSIQPSLWNIKRLKTLLGHHRGCSIWNFEEAAQQTCRKKMHIRGAFSYQKGAKRGLYHWDNSAYPYVATAIVKGKWNTGEYPELQKTLVQYDVDVQNRGVYSP